MDKRAAQMYRKELGEETKKLFLAHFEGRKKLIKEILLGLLLIFLTLLVMCVFKGHIDWQDAWIAIIPPTVVPLIEVIVVWFGSKKVAQVDIFKKYKRAYDSRHTSDIDIGPDRFKIPGVSGWGIRIRNDKLIQAVVEISINNEQIGRDYNNKNKGKSIGFIRNGMEKILYNDARNRVNPGKDDLVFCVFGQELGKSNWVLLTENEEIDLSPCEEYILDGSYIITIEIKLSLEENSLSMLKKLMLGREKGEVVMKILE